MTKILGTWVRYGGYMGTVHWVHGYGTVGTWVRYMGYMGTVHGVHGYMGYGYGYMGTVHGYRIWGSWL